MTYRPVLILIVALMPRLHGKCNKHVRFAWCNKSLCNKLLCNKYVSFAWSDLSIEVQLHLKTELLSQGIAKALLYLSLSQRIKNESLFKKCDLYWNGAQSHLRTQNACAVIFDKNCCKVGPFNFLFIFLIFYFYFFTVARWREKLSLFSVERQ